MPLRAFFCFHQEIFRIQATQYREQIKIQATSGIMSKDWYQNLYDYYTYHIERKSLKLPEKPPGPCLDLATPEAKNAIRDILHHYKRGLGYSEKRIYG